MTPIEATALVALALLATGFFLYQSYKLHAVLADPEHPYHDDYADIVEENSWYDDPFRPF